MKKDVVILGSKGCAKEILFVLQDNNKFEEEWNILGFIDEGEGMVLGYPILGNDDWLLQYDKEIYAVCAIGSAKIRKKIAQKFKDCPNVQFPNLISKRAVLGDHVKLGKGCIIGVGAILTVDVTVGDFVIVYTNSVVSHECSVGDYSYISPGCYLSGNVTLEEGVNLGTGSQIIQGLTVGAYATIGAGATVIRDIPADCTAVGCPAKVIKRGKK